MDNKRYLIGSSCCLFATIAWGIMFPVMRHALVLIDPFYFTTIRYTIMTAILLAYLYYKEGVGAFTLDANLLLLWAISSAGFAGFGFFVFLGQQISGPDGALSASTIMATMPLLGLLIHWLLKGKKPSLLSFALIIMSLLGVLLVIYKGDLTKLFSIDANALAYCLLFVGALCWVIYTVSATYFSQWSALKYSAISTLFSLPIMYAVVFALSSMDLVKPPEIHTLLRILPELIYMVSIAGVFSLVSWNVGNNILTPVNGVLFMNVVPIAAFLISALDGVHCNFGQIIGVCITSLALLLNNYYQRIHLKPLITPIEE